MKSKEKFSTQQQNNIVIFCALPLYERLNSMYYSIVKFWSAVPPLQKGRSP